MHKNNKSNQKSLLPFVFFIKIVLEIDIGVKVVSTRTFSPFVKPENTVFTRALFVQRLHCREYPRRRGIVPYYEVLPRIC